MSSVLMLEGKTPFEGKKIEPVAWNKIPYDKTAGGCGCAIRSKMIVLVMQISN